MLAFHKLGGVAVLQKLHADGLLLSLDLKKRKIEFVLIRQGMKRCVSDGTHSPVVFHVVLIMRQVAQTLMYIRH